MAGEQYAAPSGAALLFGKGQRPEGGNLAVDNGGELIDDNLVRDVADEVGEADAEFLAVGQHRGRSKRRCTQDGEKAED